MTYIMNIPGWRPALLNELIGRHPMAIHKRKRRDADNIARAMLAFRVPPAAGKRRVSLEISGPFRRYPDPDNVLKSWLDAMTTAGAILDDAADKCTWEKPSFVRGPHMTTITIEDLES